MVFVGLPQIGDDWMIFPANVKNSFGSKCNVTGSISEMELAAAADITSNVSFYIHTGAFFIITTGSSHGWATR
jgi:hypothetical protein